MVQKQHAYSCLFLVGKKQRVLMVYPHSTMVRVCCGKTWQRSSNSTALISVTIRPESLNRAQHCDFLLYVMDLYNKCSTVSKMPENFDSTHGLSRFSCCVGAVHSNEGLVHEERPRLRPGILHHSTVHLQRPPGPERTDSTSKGHRGRKYAEHFTSWLNGL